MLEKWLSLLIVTGLNYHKCEALGLSSSFSMRKKCTLQYCFIICNFGFFKYVKNMHILKQLAAWLDANFTCAEVISCMVPRWFQLFGWWY